MGNPFVPYDFVPDTEKNKTDPFTFKLRNVTGLEGIEITNEMRREEDFVRPTSRGVKAACKLSIVGWENGRDYDGNPLPFLPENIQKVPSILLQQVGSHVAYNTMLSESERKNS